MIQDFKPQQRQSSEKKEFALIPEGLYQVEIFDIKDIEKPDFKNPAIKKPHFTFTYVILNEGEYRGRRLWQDVSAIPPWPPSAGRKQSWMHKIVSAVEKHSITQEEANQYNAAKFNALVGKQLQVMVKHSPPKQSGKIYANVESVVSASHDLPTYKKDIAPVPADASDEIVIDNDDIPF